MSNALRESVAADVRAVVEADPTIASRLAATGQVVDISGPAEFAAGIKEIYLGYRQLHANSATHFCMRSARSCRMARVRARNSLRTFVALD